MIFFFTTRCARGHREHRAYIAKISTYKLIFEARQNGSVLIMPLGALCPLVTEGNGWLNLWVLFLWGLSAFCLLAID